MGCVLHKMDSLKTTRWKTRTRLKRPFAKTRLAARPGVASLDFILILGIVLPLVLFLWTVVPRMIRLVYQMTVVIIGSPLM
jgi:hypothetical protein